MAYKGASDGMQKKLRRFQVRDVSDVPLDLSKQEKADSLRAKVQSLVDQKTNLDATSRAMGIEIAGLNMEINSLGLKKKLDRQFHHHLLDVIKSEVTLAQWHIWMGKAKELKDKESTEEFPA